MVRNCRAGLPHLVRSILRIMALWAGSLDALRNQEVLEMRPFSMRKLVLAFLYIMIRVMSFQVPVSMLFSL